MSQGVSVLESLTGPNPKIRYGPRGGTLSKSDNYIAPVRMLPWKEFNMETIASIGGGKLLNTIRATPSLQPVLPELEYGHRYVDRESGTTFILNTWSREVVQRSMNSVRGKLPTCTWNPLIREETSEATDILVTASASYASTPARRTGPSPADSSPFASAIRYKLEAAKNAKKNKYIVPDAGATATCHTHGEACPASFMERLPKDYKPSTKWRSSEALEQILAKGKNGYLNSGLSRRDLAWPIRQAYTYCVELGCRYGCILTTEEAFVFRIRPDAESYPRLSLMDSTDQERKLKRALQTHGLIEYASFSWSEEGDNANSKKKSTGSHPKLTFNLAVWFIHVLAASQFQLAWSYNPLKSEDINLRECTHVQEPITPESEHRQRKNHRRAWPRSRNRSRKRAREDAADSYTHSCTSDSFGLTDSFQSFRSESALTDSTCVDDRLRRMPRSDAGVTSEQLDGLVTSSNDHNDGNTEPRKSKRARARVDKV